jgi:hypothetical protein
MALVPLTLAGALGSSTGYMHAVYMLTVNPRSPLRSLRSLRVPRGMSRILLKFARQALPVE